MYNGFEIGDIVYRKYSLEDLFEVITHSDKFNPFNMAGVISKDTVYDKNAPVVVWDNGFSNWYTSAGCEKLITKEEYNKTLLPVWNEVLSLARKYYFKHNKLDSVLHDFMWRQCSEEYRKAWLVIAFGDLEEEIRVIIEGGK